MINNNGIQVAGEKRRPVAFVSIAIINNSQEDPAAGPSITPFHPNATEEESQQKCYSRE